MHGKDLVDGPIGHGIHHEYYASGYLMSRLACAFYGRQDLSHRNSARRLDSPLDEGSGVARVQAFGRVIRLLRPRRFTFFNQLHAAAVDYVELTAAFAKDDKRCPS